MSLGGSESYLMQTYNWFSNEPNSTLLYHLVWYNVTNATTTTAQNEGDWIHMSRNIR